MAEFVTTPWTLIAQLRSEGGPELRRRAADELARLYMPVVRTFLQRRGMCADAADEECQAFFAKVVVSRELFARADVAQGRMRNLLLKALQNHLRDGHRGARGRTGWETDVSVRGATSGADVEAAFDQEFALSMLREALRRTEAHYRRQGRGAHWECFVARVVAPATTRVESPSNDDLAARHGFSTPAAVSAAIQVVKEGFRAHLHGVVLESAGEGAGFAEELAWFHRTLGLGGLSG